MGWEAPAGPLELALRARDLEAARAALVGAGSGERVLLRAVVARGSAVALSLLPLAEAVLRALGEGRAPAEELLGLVVEEACRVTAPPWRLPDTEASACLGSTVGQAIRQGRPLEAASAVEAALSAQAGPEELQHWLLRELPAGRPELPARVQGAWRLLLHGGWDLAPGLLPGLAASLAEGAEAGAADPDEAQALWSACVRPLPPFWERSRWLKGLDDKGLSASTRAALRDGVPLDDVLDGLVLGLCARSLAVDLEGEGPALCRWSLRLLHGLRAARRVLEGPRAVASLLDAVRSLDARPVPLGIGEPGVVREGGLPALQKALVRREVFDALALVRALPEPSEAWPLLFRFPLREPGLSGDEAAQRFTLVDALAEEDRLLEGDPDRDLVLLAAVRLVAAPSQRRPWLRG